LKENIALIKTEDRLIRNISSEDLTTEINDQLMGLVDDKIDKDMVIAIDQGDLMMHYAKSMEYLYGIYYDSNRSSTNGYHLYQVTTANLAHNKIALFIAKHIRPQRRIIMAVQKN
jgi:hypothetical protein